MFLSSNMIEFFQRLSISGKLVRVTGHLICRATRLEVPEFAHTDCALVSTGRHLQLSAMPAALAQQSFTVMPTTTLSAETANNTSAYPSFAALSNGDIAPGNVSKLPTTNLLYSGATTAVYAQFQPWFGQSSHINVGYNSDDPTQVQNQVTDMVSRGISGAIVDWYGPDAAVENNTTLLMKTEAENRNGAFVFAVQEDVGALGTCAATSGCNLTQQLISDLTYAYNNYEASKAYMRSMAGRSYSFSGSINTPSTGPWCAAASPAIHISSSSAPAG